MTNANQQIIIYTWGYHNANPETLATIRQLKKALIVDTRFMPAARDRRWARVALATRFGADYIWMREFGNRNYKGGWLDPIELDNPAAGLSRLEPLISADRPPILLCMCPTPYCHRKDAAEFLERERGWRIEHLPTLTWKPGDPIEPPASARKTKKSTRKLGGTLLTR